MEVKTGVLRDNLSKYLKRVKQSGETIVVMDRDEPIAEIRPFSGETVEEAQGVWGARKQFEADQGALDETVVLPKRKTEKRKYKNPLD